MSWFSYSELRELGVLKFSKWFPHVGTFRVIQKHTNGELRLYVSEKGGVPKEYSSITDSKAMDMFIWLGRYLALKGKLPADTKLLEASVLANQVATDMRQALTRYVYDRNGTDTAGAVATSKIRK